MYDWTTPKFTANELRARLDYNQETGNFHWRISPGGRAKKGGIAGRLSSSSYIQIMVFGERFVAHRLAWFYVHGVWPSQTIDHINGSRADNRIANLRDVSMQANNENLKCARKSNRLNFLGVRRNHKRFKAEIVVAGTTIYLGTFDDPQEAYTEYLKAKRERHSGNTL